MIAALVLFTAAANASPPAATVPTGLLLNESFVAQSRPELDRSSTLDTAAPPPVDHVAFNNPRSIAAFILSSIDAATVYPTERYYYYQFWLGPRCVSGNLRFTAIEDGLLHMGYFDAFDQSDTHAKTFDADDGLSISHAPAPDGDGDVYTVTLDGHSAAFTIPRRYREAGRGMELAPGERWVSGVLDESAHALVLLYDEAEPGFRFVAAPGFEPSEPYDAIADDLPHVVVGRESRFVYYRTDDPPRSTLIGVWDENVRRNTYFDGPFDQVPPDLDLRPLLHRAYPYTQDASPVDQHGNFVGRRASRVAISPYIAYDTLAGLARMIRSVEAEAPSPLDRVRALTREMQQSFDPGPSHPGSQRGIPATEGPLTIGEIIERNRRSR